MNGTKIEKVILWARVKKYLQSGVILDFYGAYRGQWIREVHLRLNPVPESLSLRQEIICLCHVEKFQNEVLFCFSSQLIPAEKWEENLLESFIN